MVKVSGLYLTGIPSYGPLKLKNWMCVEDPFLLVIKITVRPNKVLKKFLVLLPGQFSCLVNFLPSESAQTDRQIITKRHYDRKYMHEICIIEVVN